MHHNKRASSPTSSSPLLSHPQNGIKSFKIDDILGHHSRRSTRQESISNAHLQSEGNHTPEDFKEDSQLRHQFLHHFPVANQAQNSPSQFFPSHLHLQSHQRHPHFHATSGEKINILFWVCWSV